MERIIVKGVKIHIIGLMFLFVAAWAGSATAQAADGDVEPILQEISSAFKIGSARELVKYVNPTRIGITLNGQEASYSKAQAEFMLRDFFKQHTPVNFWFDHRGTSRNGIHYFIAKYQYRGGTFTVYGLIKKINGKYRIDTISFTPNK